MSTKSAGLAKKIGYSNIQVMLQGEPGWEKSGRVLVASQKAIEKGNIVLVDLRDRKEAEAGHIPRAVNIPFSELEDVEDEFPSNMAAPIVFYGNGNQAEEAAKLLRDDWGYKTVAVVPGGYEKWAKDKRQTAKGAAATEINWVRQLEPGEVSIADFKKSIGGGTDKMILDVRTKDEAATGKFAGAINIPLDELEKRLAELPKDKEMLIHCTTGARAEMAYDSLKKAGFKSRYCVANVDCEQGNCTITE